MQRTARQGQWCVHTFVHTLATFLAEVLFTVPSKTTHRKLVLASQQDEARTYMIVCSLSMLEKLALSPCHGLKLDAHAF